MIPDDYIFNETTLLITHFNRSSSLENLLRAFQQQNCCFGEIIVSDDASEQKHLNKIFELQNIYKFKLLTTKKNSGLGNNINKGQDAVSTPYTLYVQEDFEPIEGFRNHFYNALKLLKENEDIDIVRFYAYTKFPYLEPYKYGYSRMIFNKKLKGYSKFYYYSDHPHLRRSSFCEKFGKYKEGVNAERAEYHMMISFLQRKGNGLFFDNYQSLFRHANSSDEPSTMERNSLRRSKNPIISAVRGIYRHIGFNFDLNFIRH